MSAVIDHGHTDHHHGPAKGLMRWVLTTNHKDIGTMYLWFSFAMFLLGGSMAMVIRAELFQPGLQIVQPEFFNQMTTMHGLIMVFGAVMPAFVGLANWMIPLMIGAPDMALPRMNNFSFWLLPAAFGLLISTLFMEGGGPNFGWTFYAPLSTTYGPESTTFFIFAIHLMGISSIMGAINVVATILNLRAPGMTLMKMPLFVWTWLITAFLLIAVMPVLAGCVTMMLMDIHFGTSFFNAAGGGDPVLFQHVFWFFGHPEVYIMILPAFGAVSSIIPAFARKPLFGYTSMVYATGAIAFLSFIVWAHHMFVVGIPLVGELFFMYATLLIAVMPVLAGAVTMLLTDRHFGTHFFDAAGGGDPILFQHLFWFFGHPEVYILLLPVWGLMPHVLATFSRKPLFGYTSMVYATASIAFLSFIVWAHHMFTVGMPLGGELYFMFATMLISIPTGVKVFNWIATMWEGSMTFETPMLFAIGFVCLFTMGGLSGVVLSVAAVDVQLHATYYVVAHFHYVLVAGALFSLFAALYYWFPKMTGRMYSERLGRLHFWWSLVWFNVTFFPMHFLGLAGMPRRIPDYALQFTGFNSIATVGAFMFGFGQLLVLANILWSLRYGPPAPAKPWEGAETLEWTEPSPAPYHSFADPREVEHAEFGLNGVVVRR